MWSIEYTSLFAGSCLDQTRLEAISVGRLWNRVRAGICYDSIQTTLVTEEFVEKRFKATVLIRAVTFCIFHTVFYHITYERVKPRYIPGPWIYREIRLVKANPIYRASPPRKPWNIGVYCTRYVHMVGRLWTTQESRFWKLNFPAGEEPQAELPYNSFGPGGKKWSRGGYRPFGVSFHPQGTAGSARR